MRSAPRFVALFMLPLLLAACGTAGTGRAPGVSIPAHDGDAITATPGGPGSGGGDTPGPGAPPSATSLATRSAVVHTPSPACCSATPRPSSAPRSSAGGGGCPDPRYCPDYITSPNDGRWPADASGRATIHYRINPSHPAVNTGLTDSQVISAIEQLAQRWHDADPSVTFLDDGVTSDQPIGFNNVVGFTAAAGNAAANIPLSFSSDGRTITGFDIQLAPSGDWYWKPCDGAATPCDPYGGAGTDLGAVLAHAWGHALGLGDLGAIKDQLLTDSGGITAGPDCSSYGPICRYAVTLGLGDVLGARHLYPTSAPMPFIPYDQ
jgi:hypothetical protein